MTLPSIQELQALTRKHVIEADKQDTLHDLTPKLLRRGIEKELTLDEGGLDAAEYRSAIKDAIAATMVEIGIEKSHNVVKIATKTDSFKGVKRKKCSTESEVDEGSKKKTKASHHQDGDKKPAKNEHKPAGTMETSSLQEQMMEDPASSQQEKLPAKQRKEALVHIDDSENEKPMEEAKAVPQSTKTRLSDRDIRLPGDPSSSSSLENSNAKTEYKSESELSVLIDEPLNLKRKREKKVEEVKSTNGSSDVNTKRGTIGRVKKSENPNKDEETIQRLKSLVNACGVRRVWSKVFQGLDTPAQKIKKLKEILHELGMTGRLSLEKAKAIREKREFAQELQDVQEFQKAIMKSGRKHHVIATNDDNDNHESNSEDEEDENPKNRRRKMNAAQSISAFLGDQSSDEDRK